MGKHTPGPWKAFPKVKYGEWHVSVPVDGSTMKRGLFPDGIGTANPEADARLIAAAPTMLEALQGLVRWYDETCVCDCEHDPEIIAARAAIRAATGGENG